jgi:hypothetical protein
MYCFVSDSAGRAKGKHIRRHSSKLFVCDNNSTDQAKRLVGALSSTTLSYLHVWQLRCAPSKQQSHGRAMHRATLQREEKPRDRETACEMMSLLIWEVVQCGMSHWVLRVVPAGPLQQLVVSGKCPSCAVLQGPLLPAACSKHAEVTVLTTCFLRV